MVAYGIIRADKVKMANIGSGLQEHHQRSDKDGHYNNPDIDLSKSGDNVELVHSDSFRQSVGQKIKEYDITRKIRDDAVGLIDGLATVSGEFFKDKNREQIIDYYKNMIPLIEKEFGPIISAVIHFDELRFNKQNIHMHFATVPIVQNENGSYSLSAKKLMGNQKEYIARQDRFYEQYFKQYGLERGTSAKETHSKHIDQNRWKAEQAKQQATEYQILSDNAISALSAVMLETEQLKAQRETEAKKVGNLQQTNEELNRHISAKQKYMAKQNKIVYDDSKIDDLAVAKMLKDGYSTFLLDCIVYSDNTDFVDKYLAYAHNQIESDIEQAEPTVRIDNDLIALLESEDYAIG